MLLKPDCIPCILKVSISLIRKLSLTEDAEKDLYTEILKIPALRGLSWDRTSPEVIEHVMKKITAAVDNPDPFYSEKFKQNKSVIKQYPILKQLVKESLDHLYTAVKLAILGNSIDFMMSDDPLDFEKSIKEKLETSLSKVLFEEFKARLEKSKLLLYVGDNAGEIVFDKLLIETIKNQYNLKIVYIVRSIPTLNDATLKEANSVGIDQVVSVIENGIDGPLPGTILKRCSNELKELVHRADLIISKGGGNFDTLEEETKHLKKITFMLLSKCFPYKNYFGIDLYQPILANFY